MQNGRKRAGRAICILVFVLTAAFAGECQQQLAPTTAVSPISQFEKPVEVKPGETRVVDARFVAFSAVLMAFTVSDLEKTHHCLARATCMEMNPMLPHSRAGMYAVNLPINAATMYLGYRLKSAGRRTWWIAPALVTAGHVVGTGFRF